MANDELGQVQALRLRVCKIDSNGVPSPGASSLYVTSSFIRVKTTPVYVDPTEIEAKNAAGAVCVNWRGQPSLKRYDVELELCTPNPDLVELIGVGTKLTTAVGVRVGWAAPSYGAQSSREVSLEWWTRRVEDGTEATDGYPYAWWAAPRAKNWKQGERTFEDGTVATVLTGELYENPNWYNGPDNLWPAASTQGLQWVMSSTLPATTSVITTLTGS